SHGRRPDPRGYPRNGPRWCRYCRLSAAPRRQEGNQPPLRLPRPQSEQCPAIQLMFSLVPLMNRALLRIQIKLLIQDRHGISRACNHSLACIAQGARNVHALRAQALQCVALHLPVNRARWQQITTKRSLQRHIQPQVDIHQMRVPRVAYKQVLLFVLLYYTPPSGHPGHCHLNFPYICSMLSSQSRTAGQALSSKSGWAAAVGCTPSSCIIPSTPPTPSSRKGTSVTSRSSATW